MVNPVSIEGRRMASTQHRQQQDAECKELWALYILSAGVLLLAVIAVAFGISDLTELIHLLASPTNGRARP